MNWGAASWTFQQSYLTGMSVNDAFKTAMTTLLSDNQAKLCMCHDGENLRCINCSVDPNPNQTALSSVLCGSPK
jgi:hypothetical protein